MFHFLKSDYKTHSALKDDVDDDNFLDDINLLDYAIPAVLLLVTKKLKLKTPPSWPGL